MEEVFVSRIHINNVRHLNNLDIPLSDSERKHLILTGPNGSGKTSFLLALKEYLAGIENNSIYDVVHFQNQIEIYQQRLIQIEQQLKQAISDIVIIDLNNNKLIINQQIQDTEKQFKALHSLNVDFKGFGNTVTYFQKGNLILAYFDAKRLTNFRKPTGPNRVELKGFYSFEDKINSNFIQYIVNMRYDRLDAKDSNNEREMSEIDNWFNRIVDAFKYIFDDDSLILEFDRPNYNYNIVLKNREKFNLNMLSDGYSAVINIISELILRMENKKQSAYDVQGIVLIDEIETHLHIDLQKKILPFLTAFFPKIQFIVTTHSPFVLTSVKNAVVYDLENQEPIEDLSRFSVEAVIEAYFGESKYSEILIKKVEEYEKLMSKNNLSDNEKEVRFDLKQYFKTLPPFLAPELQVKIQQIELAQIGK